VKRVEIEADLLSAGHSWTECPRRHDGQFTFTDMYNARIVRIDANGQAETMVDFSARATVGDLPMIPLGADFRPLELNRERCIARLP
jgi:hypothetical protein